MSFNIRPLTIPLFQNVGIHGYGITILIGLVVFFIFTYKHLQKVYPISFDTLSSLLTKGLIVGILGGRLLYTITEWRTYNSFIEILQFWKGGFSIFGTTIALCIYVPYTLKKQNIKLFPTLDIAATYAPIAHAIGRLGCLWTGCCFGCSTHAPFSITYTGQTAGAPMNIPLIPVQLYSSILLFILFLVLKYLIAPNFKTNGTIVLSYVLGLATERFITDFLRNDRAIQLGEILSFYQWIALVLINFVLIVIVLRKKVTLPFFK